MACRSMRLALRAIALGVVVGCGSATGGQPPPGGTSSVTGVNDGGVSSGSGAPSSGGRSSIAGGSSSSVASTSGTSTSQSSSAGSGASDAGVAAMLCTAPVFTTSDETGGQTFGAYYLYNDMWNTSDTLGPQTLSVCSYNSWYVVSNQTDQAGAVLTYPNVQENFTQTVSSFHGITSTFAETSPRVGIYEDAYDIWFDGFGAGHVELMIWVDNYKQVPAGDKVTTTTLSGRTYDVYRTSDGSYLAFVATVTFTSGTIDLYEIFNYAIGKSWLASSAMLSQIDFGVEIVDTAGTSARYDFTDFSITAN